MLAAGAAYVPLDPAHPAERRAALLDDAGATLVVTVRAGAGDGCGRPEIALETELGDEGPLEAPALGGGDLAYVMYTSGSTGAPKGVAVPHRAVARLVKNTDYVRLGPDDVVAQVSNPAFDAATFEIWGALLNGARLVVIPSDIVLSPPRLAEALARHGVTTLFLTTALFNLVARAASRRLPRAAPGPLRGRGGGASMGRGGASRGRPRRGSCTCTARPRPPPSRRGTRCRGWPTAPPPSPSDAPSPTPRSTSSTRGASRCRSAWRARSTSAGRGWRTATWAAPISPPSASSRTRSIPSRARASTAPATARASAPTARWSFSAASIGR